MRVKTGWITVITVAGKEYSLWDDFLVYGRCDRGQEMTLGELLLHMKQTYNLEITGLFYGNAVLYDVGSNHTERLVKSVSDVVSLVTKLEVSQHLHMLEMFPSFAEDKDCETVPPIRYLFR
nr:ubiquitin-like modifier-activating enzyme 1 [Oncorhynchus nerka]